MTGLSGIYERREEYGELICRPQCGAELCHSGFRLFLGFPKMFSFWKNIPLLGSFSLAIIVLVGSGIYFTIRLGFIQVRLFSVGVHTLASRRSIKAGISPLAAFLLSTAMRVGPGNMIGVTGAIAAGGPGALFWMWVSAFFGMATAFTEGTLAQIFKEKEEIPS